MNLLLKNRKGFTLIELLAIIIIIGIIAVIAVPTVKNLTDDAKKKAFINTARGIIKAGDLYYSRKDMNDEIDGNMEFTFPDNAEELQLQGKLPEKGKMIINEDGDIKLAISNKNYCITKDFTDKDIIITEDFEACEISDGSGDNYGNGGIKSKTLTELAVDSINITRVDGTASSEVVKPACLSDGTECTPGTPVAVRVNDTEIYKFYVISEINNEVTLIMDRNLGENVAWITLNDYATANTDETVCNYDACNDEGPISALNYLNSKTSNWTNISAIKSYTYNDKIYTQPNFNGTTIEYGYQKLEITDGTGILTRPDGITTTLTGTMRARLLTYDEAASQSIGCTTNRENESCPSWIFENLYSTGDPNAVAYWTTTSSYIDSAWLVHGAGYLADFFVPSYSSQVSADVGIRPVITLYK